MKSVAVCVVSWGPNRLDIFGIGNINQMLHKAWDGSAWLPSPTGWESLGGIFESSPAVVSWGPNRLDIFGLGVDSQMYHKAWDGSAWLPSNTGWELVGGVFDSLPAVASWGPNRLDIFGRGTDNQMYHKAWNGRAWLPSPTGWDTLGGTFDSAPAVVSWGPNRLDIFGLGNRNEMYHKAWDGSAWLPSLSEWEPLGGVFNSPPAVASWGLNRLDIFGLGTDNQMYHKAWDGSAWLPSNTGWDALGGTFDSAPSVVSWGPNRLDIFGLGTGDQMYHKAWDGSAWVPSNTGWELLGEVFNSSPAVASWGPNRLDIFGLRTDNQMLHKAWDVGAWLPSGFDWDVLGGAFTFPQPSWSPLTKSPGGFASAMWLMQDGSVLVNLYNSKQLMALHPDKMGSYANGSWTPAGNLLLEKWAFTSGVLSDGRLIACGGEYSGPGLPETETNFCEVYDPGTQSSRQFSPPPGWTNIGDGPSAILNDGTLMVGSTQGKGYQVALLDPSTLTWTFGVGDSDNEQGYTLMQTGDVLTTGVYDQTSKRYDPKTKAFVPDAMLPVMLGAGSETGPGITLMDGRVIWFGASGHTCIYTPGAEGTNGTWVQGPDLPKLPNGDQLTTADVSAILEPSGRVFLVARGSNTATLFLEYDPDPQVFTIVQGAPDGDNQEYCRTLLLPNGHGLVSLATGLWYEVAFRPGGKAAWAPTITFFPKTVAQNSTVELEGTQLCGLSECQSYGDDNQQAENYPMVRFVDSQGALIYLRAHDVSTRSIAPGQPGVVLVDIPASLPLGTYSVEVVAMGIASGPGTTVNVVP